MQNVRFAIFVLYIRNQTYIIFFSLLYYFKSDSGFNDFVTFFAMEKSISYFKPRLITGVSKFHIDPSLISLLNGHLKMLDMVHKKNCIEIPEIDE